MTKLASCLRCVTSKQIYTGLKKYPCVRTLRDAFPEVNEDIQEAFNCSDCFTFYGSSSDITSGSDYSSSSWYMFIIMLLVGSVVVMTFTKWMYFSKAKSSEKCYKLKTTTSENISFSTSLSDKGDVELANV